MTRRDVLVVLEEVLAKTFTGRGTLDNLYGVVCGELAAIDAPIEVALTKEEVSALLSGNARYWVQEASAKDKLRKALVAKQGEE